MLHRFFTWVVTHRAVTVGVWVLCVVVAAPFALQVKPDFAVEQFFPQGDAVRASYDRFKQSFPGEDAQVAAFLDAGADGLDAQELSTLQKLGDAFGAAGLHDVVHVGNAVRLVVDREGVSHEVPLITDRSSAATIASALAPFHEDALYRGIVMDRELRLFAVLGTLPAERNTELGRGELNNSLTATLQALDPGQHQLSLSGLPVLRARYLVLLQQDQGLYVTVAILLCFVLLYGFYRSAWQTFAVLLAVLPAYLWTLVGLYAVGRPLTALTAIVPVLLLVVGISDSTHLLTESRRRRKAGIPWRESVAGAFVELALPCLGTAATTAIGFLALLTTQISIVVDFGLLSGVAVLLTWASTMAFVPAFLALTPDAKFKDGFAESRALAASVEGCLAIARRAPRLLTAVAVVLLVGSIPPLFRLAVDVKMIDERDSHVLIRDIRAAEDRGFAMFQVNVLLEPDNDKDGARVLLGRDLRLWMARLQKNMSTDPRVTGSLSPRDYAEHAFGAAFGGESSEGGLGDLFDDQLVDALWVAAKKPGSPLRGLVDVEQRRAQVLLFVRDAGSKATHEMLEVLRADIASHPPPGAHATVTGTVVLAQGTFDRLVTGFLQSLILSTVLIFLVLLLHFRSLLWAVTGMLPNIIPLVVLLGALALAGLPVTPTLVLVFSIATGLVVDDTIHLHLAIQQRRKQGLSFLQATESATRERGPAIVQTAIVLTLAFCSLVVSQFFATFLMGLLLAGALAIGLIAELIFFPAAVRALHPREDAQKKKSDA